VPARVLKRVTNDLFRSRTRDQFQTLHDLVRLPVLDPGVKILFVLTHNYDVHHWMLRLDERMIRDARTYVGVQPEHFTNSYIQALVATALRRGDGRLKKDFGAS